MSEYECREAAVFAMVPWHQFMELPYEDRVKIVAHRRITKLIEQHYLADASMGL